MRFADMMGSEDERSPEPPVPPAPPAPAADSETGAAVEGTFASRVQRSGSVDTETRGAVAPVATMEDVARSAMADVAATEPAETRVADFTPYSDDLLPHRR